MKCRLSTREPETAEERKARRARQAARGLPADRWLTAEQREAAIREVREHAARRKERVNG